MELSECPQCGYIDLKKFSICPACGLDAAKQVKAQTTGPQGSKFSGKAVFGPEDEQPLSGDLKEGREIVFNERIAAQYTDPSKIKPQVSFTSHGESLQAVLETFVGHKIGINYDDATKSKPAKLVAAASDHFTVTSTKTGLVYHFPYAGITGLVEAPKGKVKSGSLFGFEAKIFVSVYHQVVYKGAIGFGFGVPVGGGD